MSLIHDALQNVESYVGEVPNSPDDHSHEKNELYKVNRFDLSLANIITFALMMGGSLAVCYLLYMQFLGGKAPENDAALYQSSLYGNEETLDSNKDATLSLANDLDVNSIVVDQNAEELSQSVLASEEGVDSAVLESRSAGLINDRTATQVNSVVGQISSVNSELNDDIDAINGGIVGSSDVTEQASAAFKGSGVASLQRSADVPVLDNNAINVENESLTQSQTDLREPPQPVLLTTSLQSPSDYFTLQSEAYDFMVQKDFVSARERLNQILLADANDYSANINLALVDIQENNYQQAYGRLLQLKSRYPFKQRVDELILLVEGYRSE